MLRYEARFHPRGETPGTHIVVAYLTWREGKFQSFPEIEPVAGSSTVFSTLRHLVRLAGQGCAERLRSLSCEEWSFVDVSARG